jgi:hypothetical protein
MNYTKENVLGFNESDWEFRISSGYAGYNNIKYPNDEQKWIYESEYEELKKLKSEYEKSYSLLLELQHYQQSYSTSEGLWTSEIESFLDFKFFNNKNEQVTK